MEEISAKREMERKKPRKEVPGEKKMCSPLIFTFF